MTQKQIFETLAKYAIEEGPAFLDALARTIARALEAEPELRSPPRHDRQAAIDAQVDEALGLGKG